MKTLQQLIDEKGLTVPRITRRRLTAPRTEYIWPESKGRNLYGYRGKSRETAKNLHEQMRAAAESQLTSSYVRTFCLLNNLTL